MKKLIYSGICLFASLTLVISVNASNASVVINGERLDAAPVNKNSRLLVPVRKVFENIGAEIDWIEEEKQISIGVGGKVAKFIVGSTEAVMETSGIVKTITAEPPPEIINGNVYIPVLAVADILNASVTWDAAEKTAYVDFEQYPLTDKKELNLIFRNKVIQLGGSGTQAERLLGECDYKLPSAYSYDWMSYKANGSDFGLIGVNEGNITAFYTNSVNTSIAGIKPGMTSDALEREVLIKLPEQPVNVLRNKHGVLTIYRDSDYSVLAVMAQKTDYTDSSYTPYGNVHLQSSERLLFDIINTERANRGLPAFANEESVVKTAREHSRFMAKSGSLTFESGGNGPFDRLNANDVDSYSVAASAVGRECVDAIEMYAQWMDSLITKANIISDEYNYIGIGAADGGETYKEYFTAYFIGR